MPVFAREPRGERPPTRSGHWEAISDPRAIEGWWVRWPSANVRVPSDNESGPVVLGLGLDAGGSGSLAALEREGGSLDPRGACLARGCKRVGPLFGFRQNG